jgi:hypothetical protein
VKPLIAAVLTSLTLAAPVTAQAAELTVDPQQRCYREDQIVFLPGSGFTPNTPVGFSANGKSLQTVDSDAAGNLLATLELREMRSGQERVSFVATDSANPANFAEVELLVTATSIKPFRGASNRRLPIVGRGFFGGSTLWAHIVRDGEKRARTIRIGRVRGACRKVRARRRLFSAETPPGRYVIQFDTFRRYRDRREIEYEYPLTIAPRRD